MRDTPRVCHMLGLLRSPPLPCALHQMLFLIDVSVPSLYRRRAALCGALLSHEFISQQRGTHFLWASGVPWLVEVFPEENSTVTLPRPATLTSPRLNLT